MKMLLSTALLFSSLSSFAGSLNLNCDDQELDTKISVTSKTVSGHFSDIEMDATFVKSQKVNGQLVYFYEDIFHGVKAQVRKEGKIHALELTFPEFQWTLGCSQK